MALGSPILRLIAGAQGYSEIYSLSVFFIVALIVLYTFTIGHKKAVK